MSRQNTELLDSKLEEMIIVECLILNRTFSKKLHIGVSVQPVIVNMNKLDVTPLLPFCAYMHHRF